jgi:hypothetical protein
MLMPVTVNRGGLLTVWAVNPTMVVIIAPVTTENTDNAKTRIELLHGGSLWVQESPEKVKDLYERAMFKQG